MDRSEFLVEAEPLHGGVGGIAGGVVAGAIAGIVIARAHFNNDDSPTGG